MEWSHAIWRIAGIELRVHYTFYIHLAFLGITFHAVGGPVAAVNAVAFILALFGCVLLHELGHALAARRYDIRTPDITLLPIGGLARLQRMPGRPSAELVIAVAKCRRPKGRSLRCSAATGRSPALLRPRPSASCSCSTPSVPTPTGRCGGSYVRK
ncbi:MAG: hypothetical protein JJU00_08610 [Opitutales bacterium]|nr:hypothetical protein [Opitutales bacterium]